MILPGPAHPLTYSGVAFASGVVGVGQPLLWSVVHVETSGCGFFRCRRPTILFERHVFHRLTKGEFDAEHPDISNPTPGGYGAHSAQYEKLHSAIRLNETAALESTSWGLGQIMGFNHALAGFASARAMVDVFCESEDEQILAIAWFIRLRRLDEALRNRQWEQFAAGYNGPAHAKNRYVEKLEAAYQRFKARGLPDLLVRARQMELFFDGRYNGQMDGIVGPKTTAAEQDCNGRVQT